MAWSHVPDADSTFLRAGSETGALIAQFDWATTSLGPIAAWPEYLKTAVSILLDSPLPMVLLWGPEGVLIYNDSCARQMALPHTKTLGNPVREVWPEYAALADQILQAGLAGRALSLHDLEFEPRIMGQEASRWFDLDCSPVRDARGRPAGVLVVSIDITQPVLAGRKAARKVELRALFEQAPGAICILSGPDLIVEFTNAAHRRLFGVQDAEGRPHAEAFSKFIAMRDRPEIVRRVYETGVRYVGHGVPLLVPRPDGGEEEHLLDLVLEPVLDEEGQVQGLFLEGFDVTEQLRARQAAEHNARRLSAALAIARLGTFEWDPATKSFTFDARAREILGFDSDEPVSLDDMFARIDLHDFLRIQAVADAAETAEAAGRTRREHEYSVNLPDGSSRRVTVVADLLARDGKSRRFTGVIDDVTERRAAERRQRMLINELNHRVKNTLATVQSIAAQTLRAAPNVGSAREDFESRLVALAAAHDLLTAEGWHGATMADVAATAMSPFAATHRPQIARAGPHVWLTAQQALALNLALHELATNAAKYGALSTPGGFVDVSWTVHDSHLALRWVEKGGPPVAVRAHAGFGARLLQRSLAHELGGAVDWTFAAEGVRCAIRCKVEQVAAATPVEVAEAAALRFNF